VFATTPLPWGVSFSLGRDALLASAEVADAKRIVRYSMPRSLALQAIGISRTGDPIAQISIDGTMQQEYDFPAYVHDPDGNKIELYARRTDNSVCSHGKS
jgi:hypothetical protein